MISVFTLIWNTQLYIFFRALLTNIHKYFDKVRTWNDLFAVSYLSTIFYLSSVVNFSISILGFSSPQIFVRTYFHKALKSFLFCLLNYLYNIVYLIILLINFYFYSDYRYIALILLLLGFFRRIWILYNINNCYLKYFV